MKKLIFNITVPDKYTGKEYKAGEVYPFEDARAEEILKARTSVTGEPYAVEFVEEVIEEIPEEELKRLEDLKVSELKEIAEQKGIENYKSMKKDELIKVIEESAE